LWGDLLQRASELRNTDHSLLWDATQKYRTAAATATTGAVVYTHWAQALARLGRADEAEKVFKRSVDEYPRDYLGYFDWAEYLSGNSLTPTGDLDGIRDFNRLRHAARLYRLSISHNPEIDWTWVRLGQVELLLDRPAEAQAAFQRGIALNGRSVEAREGLCQSLEAAHDPDEPLARSRASAVRAAAGRTKPWITIPNSHPCAATDGPAGPTPQLARTALRD
jgi:tetratricopeptide (TPR) repeat protein